jgi:hypothetical protein
MYAERENPSGWGAIRRIQPVPVYSIHAVIHRKKSVEIFVCVLETIFSQLHIKFSVEIVSHFEFEADFSVFETLK